MAIGWGYERMWIGWFTIPIGSIFIRDYYLQYTNFLSLSDKESVIVSPCYHCPYFAEEGEKILKQCQSSQDFLASWSFDAAWISSLTEVGKYFILLGRLHAKIRRCKFTEVSRKGVLVGIVRMFLWTSKSGIGRWRLTEVGKRIFLIVGVVLCTSEFVEMNKHLPFRRESSILCIEDRVVVDHVV